MEATVSYSLSYKIYHFKAKDSEIKDHALCLGNILQLIRDCTLSM